MVYVKTPADVFYSRLQYERAKGPDKQISKEYLEQLEYRHEQMLRYAAPNFSMVVDGMQPIEHNVKELISFVDGAVRMGVFGVTPQPYQAAAPLTDWGTGFPPAQVCTKEVDKEKVTIEKDYSDTSTDPDIDPIACQVCKCQTDWAQMLLCDKCDNDYHMGCLAPPLFRVPDDEWL
jgi:hypothetical protein